MSADPNVPGLDEAQQRYLTDPLFHARVDAAVASLRVDMMGRPNGGVLSERERTVAVAAAALGLLMAEVDWTAPHPPPPPGPMPGFPVALDPTLPRNTVQLRDDQGRVRGSIVIHENREPEVRIVPVPVIDPRMRA